MSIPKVVGIEEEYAIQMQGGHGLTPFQASCLLVNSYARKAGLRNPGTKFTWDYGHETPFNDFRGDLFRKSTGQEIIPDEENIRINTALPNGARLYTDHAHPEYSTPECLSAKEAVACDKAGEMILREALAATRATVPSLKIGLFKNNTDHQGHSYGCHENYLMDAESHEECLVRTPEKAMRSLVPFLVTRQILAGAGRIGSEKARNLSSPFLISQRAHFMETVFGLETMYARPIINTRAEHHADPKRFRRLHLILGDANMSEFAGFLKIGTTQIVLQMLEDNFLTENFTLRDPVKALRKVAGFGFTLELADGRTVSCLDIQRAFLAKAQDYCRSASRTPVPDADFILQCWANALDGLEKLKLSKDLDIVDDPLQLARRLDWVAKLWLIQRFRQGKNRSWDSPELRVFDLQYHNIEPESGLFGHLQSRGHVDRLLEDAEVIALIKEPPPDTRAYFRGKCIEKFPNELLMVNWEVVGFDHGEIHRMVPLLNPLKGTRGQFHDLFERCSNSKELLEMVQA
jgi:proteasome accessory factor PafA2